MSVVSKYLFSFAGLTLTVLLIYSGMSIYEKSKSTANMLIEKQEERVQDWEEYDIVKYDGYEISGSMAISYLKQVVDNYMVPVTVITEKEVFTVEDSSVYGMLRKTESEFYVNPFKTFVCEVNRDVNDVITGVKLTYVQ